MKAWHTIFALVLVSVSAYWWAKRSQRDEIEQLRSSVRSVTQSLEDTNRTVAHNAIAQLHVLPTTSSSTAPAQPASATLAPDSSQPAGPSSEPARQPGIDPATLRAHLSSRFDGQATDSAWSGAATRMVESKFATLMPPSSMLKSVECKETMCRIEMVYDDTAQYQAFLRQMTPAALPWNGTFFSTIVGDPSEKPATFVAFLSREGQELAVE
jgi:cytoskeletal protein RodZ